MKKLFVSIVACLMVLGGCLLVFVHAGESVVADGGKTEYQIVIEKDADVSTKAVAKDLADILKEITGAIFPVVTDDTAAGAKEIVVGAGNARLAALGLADLAKDFAAGEYEMRTAGDSLVIAGGPLRGDINGMYGFLQDHLGCRWFTPGCMKMPKQATLKLDDIQDRQKPSFVWRSTDSCLHWDGAWTARNRFNECKTYGGTVSRMMLMSDPRVATIGNYSSCHQFSYIPGTLYDEHPEYYAEIDGKRVRHENPNQRAYCLTNDDFAEYMAGMLKRRLGRRKGPRFVGLGHADNAHYCRCEVCKASYDRVGLSGTYMEFDNKVAEIVAKEYPQAIITTLAYGITFAPTPVKMHPSVRPIWCPISCCHAHAFDECDANRDRGYYDKLAKWQANTSQLGIWYYHHQSNALIPHMKLHGTAGTFKKFEEMGIESLFVEDNCGATRRDNAAFDGDKQLSAYGNAERNGYFTVPFGLQHLRSYLVGRILWDTDFDWQDGIRDFCGTYYGAAGEELAEFALSVESIDSYEKTLGSTFRSYTGVHQSGSIAPKPKMAAIERWNALFDAAMEKVADDKTTRRRVEMVRASADLEILCFTSADSLMRQPAFDRFFVLMEELGLKAIQRTPVSYQKTTVQEFKDLMSAPDKISIPGEERVGANLLTNSSFETEIDADGIPNGWKADGRYLPEEYTVDPEGVMLDASKAHSGERSVRLTKSPAKDSIVALRQRFDAKPGARYRAKVRYQADVKTGSVHIIFTAFDKNGKWLRHQGGARGVNKTGDRWVEMSGDTQCEKDTAQLMIEFLFYDDKSEGVAWIDDFECGKLQK